MANHLLTPKHSQPVLVEGGASLSRGLRAPSAQGTRAAGTYVPSLREKVQMEAAPRDRQLEWAWGEVRGPRGDWVLHVPMANLMDTERAR